MLHQLTVGDIYWLVIAFLVKHFLADFPLQTPYMLRKSQETQWFMPLTVHALTHAVLSLLIIAPYLNFLPVEKFVPGSTILMCGGALGLVVLEGAAHWSIDFLKARVFVYPIDRPAFWISLGADQLLHYLTYVVMVAYIVRACGVAT